MIGIGAMLHQLGGNRETYEAYQKCLNKKISSVKMGDDDALHIVFEDGYKVRFFDDGQCCCEARYMRTDDNLDYFSGATFLKAEIRDAEETTHDYYEEHEIQFLVITTNKGVFTMANHNEHNGYYGGFALVIRQEGD